MRRLLVDHFYSETPTSPRARFGIPEPELLQRVNASVRQARATLEAEQVQHEILVHERMRSIHVLPEGDAMLNQLARAWDVELDGLGLTICPLLFVIHPGAHGAYSPSADLVAQQHQSADMRWLEARTPRHAILLRSEAARGVAPDCFLLRHELDHARRSIAARRGHATVERANITLASETGQQLFFGGRLEIEEVFVHAADVAAVRQLLLQIGARTYPGPANHSRLSRSLRQGNPSPQTLVGQMEMTAQIGGSIAEQAWRILPVVKVALGQDEEPTYTSHNGIVWGSLEFNDPALETPGELHLPLGADVSSSPGLRLSAFESSLSQLQSTLRDYEQFHQWVLHTLQRFRNGDLEPQRFGPFLEVTQLPAAPFSGGYRPLGSEHYEERFLDQP